MNDKPCTCGSLKPIHKNRHENVKFTFDVSKCDRITTRKQAKGPGQRYQLLLQPVLMPHIQQLVSLASSEPREGFWYQVKAPPGGATNRYQMPKAE